MQYQLRPKQTLLLKNRLLRNPLPQKKLQKKLYPKLLKKLLIKSLPKKKTVEKLPPVKPEVRKILDKLEQAGNSHKTLKADVVYTVVSRLDGDTQTRTGFVAFAGKTKTEPDKFRISFKTLKLGEDGRKTREKIDYIFDGYWFTIAKHKIKTLTRLQVATKNQKIEPMRIGSGPFPIPFGQKANDMIRMLEISTRKARRSDPKNCYYLKLIPRKKYRNQMNFKRMEMWISKDNNMPVKIRMKDKNKSKTIAEFSNIKTDAEIKSDLFEMKKPAGWKSTVKPMK